MFFEITIHNSRFSIRFSILAGFSYLSTYIKLPPYLTTSLTYYPIIFNLLIAYITTSYITPFHFPFILITDLSFDTSNHDHRPRPLPAPSCPQKITSNYPTISAFKYERFLEERSGFVYRYPACEYPDLLAYLPLQLRTYENLAPALPSRFDGTARKLFRVLKAESDAIYGG